MDNKKELIKSINSISKYCSLQTDCRSCKFGTLWNGCKLMELPPKQWEKVEFKQMINFKYNKKG